MNVVDTSAIIAILEGEPERDAFARRTSEASYAIMSAVSMLEASIVMSGRRGRAGVQALDEWFVGARIIIRPFDRSMAESAVAAYERFGKSSGSETRLNFGDCCSHAFASLERAPLLFKGADFAATDIVPATTIP
ncbi:MAG TPA: type II toxin-antitoxin system VapC family toxin [Hyphomicrobiaceae bacterium]|nr:type II toxin-antitoxin system VapC family toxin [Hyphomicrobiaceae bacterium]